MLYRNIILPCAVAAQNVVSVSRDGIVLHANSNNLRSFDRYFTKIFVMPFFKSKSLNVKVFKHNGLLYIDLGFSHWLLKKIPANLRVLCSKRALRFLSTHKTNSFSTDFRKLKSPSPYKLQGFFL